VHDLLRAWSTIFVARGGHSDFECVIHASVELPRSPDAGGLQA
jgi:hypothetical protein